MRDIPVIDMADDATDIARQVELACRNIGFMVIRGHGVGPHTIASIRQAVEHYFRRPLEDKLCDRITRDNYRGYIPQGFFSPAGTRKPADAYEGYKLHAEIAEDDPIRAACDLYGPNRWPAGGDDLRRAVPDYWQECDRVAHRLLGILAGILGVDETRFLAHFEQPLTNMTLLHYPPQDPQAGFGIHPHKDTDALTILAPDPVGGLRIRPRGRQDWLPVTAPEDALVVNLGDLLELWSGGYFVSTPHKVVNDSGKERYSFPYFAVPRFDTVVEPLVERQAGFDRASVHVGDVSREVWRTNWPDAEPLDSGFDLGTLTD